MRRLSIIDSATGRQPIHNEDWTVWVCFNGEIDSYTALKAELEGRGHRFYMVSDTETIVHAYEEWEERGVHASARDVRRLALADAESASSRATAQASSPRHHASCACSSDPRSRRYSASGAIAPLLHSLCWITIWRSSTRRASPPCSRESTSFDPDICSAGPRDGCLFGVTGSRRVSQAAAGRKRRARAPRRAPRRRAITPTKRSSLARFLSGGVSNSVVGTDGAGVEPTVKTFRSGLTSGWNDELEHARVVAAHFGTSTTTRS